LVDFHSTDRVGEFRLTFALRIVAAKFADTYAQERKKGKMTVLFFTMMPLSMSFAFSWAYDIFAKAAAAGPI
jgi:hypothetical protein